MNSILQFDDKFESLTGLLRRSPWLVLKVRILNELLSLVNNLPEDRRGMYLWELTPYLRDVFSHIHPGNTQTAAIDPHIIYFLMNNAIPLVPDEELLRGVQKVLLTAYLRLNAFDLFFKRASCWKFTFDPVDYKKILTRLPVELSGLEQKKWSLDHLKHNITGELKESLNHLQLNLSSGNTIKGLFAVSAGKFIDGMVASITLNRVQVNRGEGIDQVRISTHLVDEKDVLADQTKGMCEWLRRRYPRLKGHWIRLEYSLDQPSSLLVGNSLGLAMAQLADMELSRYGKNPSHEARIYSDVAMTGAMEEDGFVSSVDPESLKYKIHAAFFSGIRSVVIPDAQEGLVKKTVEELNRKWPFGKIKPLPVKNIASIKEHRSVLFHQRRRTSNRIRQFLKTYANSVTYAILGFILLLGAGYYFGIIKHPVPDSIICEKGDLKILNKFGYELWDIKSFIDLNKNVESYDKTIKRLTRIVDLNNNGKSEIIIGNNFNSEFGNKELLRCYNYSGEQIWEFNLNKKQYFGDNKYEIYATRWLETVDLNGDGTTEVIVIATHKFFPDRILVLDYSGNLITEYWHSGSLVSFHVVDIIKDNNRLELLSTGTNNEYKSAVMLLLDPLLMKGASPQQEYYYTTQPPQTGNEIYYVRFPNTHFANQYAKDYAELLDVNNISIELTTQVSNYLGKIVYQFDYDFVVQFTDIGDSYYSVFEKEFPDKPPLPYNDKKLIRYFKSVDYWNGDDWVKEPTMNRHYLESLKNNIITE